MRDQQRHEGRRRLLGQQEGGERELGGEEVEGGAADGATPGVGRGEQLVLGDKSALVRGEGEGGSGGRGRCI